MYVIFSSVNERIVVVFREEKFNRLFNQGWKLFHQWLTQTENFVPNKFEFCRSRKLSSEPRLFFSFLLRHSEIGLESFLRHDLRDSFSFPWRFSVKQKIWSGFLENFWRKTNGSLWFSRTSKSSIEFIHLDEIRSSTKFDEINSLPDRKQMMKFSFSARKNSTRTQRTGLLSSSQCSPERHILHDGISIQRRELPRSVFFYRFSTSVRLFWRLIQSFHHSQQKIST